MGTLVGLKLKELTAIEELTTVGAITVLERKDRREDCRRKGAVSGTTSRRGTKLPLSSMILPVRMYLLQRCVTLYLKIREP